MISFIQNGPNEPLGGLDLKLSLCLYNVDPDLLPPEVSISLLPAGKPILAPEREEALAAAAAEAAARVDFWARRAAEEEAQRAEFYKRVAQKEADAEVAAPHWDTMTLNQRTSWIEIYGATYRTPPGWLMERWFQDYSEPRHGWVRTGTFGWAQTGVMLSKQEHEQRMGPPQGWLVDAVALYRAEKKAEDDRQNGLTQAEWEAEREARHSFQLR